MKRQIFTGEHDAFRDMVRAFIAKEITPYHEQWERDGLVSRDVWLAAGRAGLLGIHIDEKYGGGGNPDYRYYLVMNEELARAGAHGPGFSVHNDIIGQYLQRLASPEQCQRWLPGYCSGEIITAIAMSEPEAGSDLQGIRTSAVRDGGHYVLNGQKTFISNGQMCDLVIAVTRTNPDGGSRGMSLILVETDRAGFRHGRNLDKLGHLSSDTSELFFDEVRVPVTNLLGAEGGAMAALMSELPQERLTIALHSIAAAQKAFDLTKAYVGERKAFGQAIGNFQNTRFKLADLKAELSVGWAYVDQCLSEHIRGELTTYAASTAKLWVTEMHGKLVDQCLQFFGGYGFMREYEICRLFADARVLRIYGGTSEIMRELVSRSL